MNSQEKVAVSLGVGFLRVELKEESTNEDVIKEIIDLGGNPRGVVAQKQ